MGTTNLPDGSLIDYYVDSAELRLRDDLPWVGGQVAVRDGGFDFGIAIPGRSPGTATVYLSFSVAWGTTQPKQVVDRFGSEGEHLAGPQVYVDSPGDPKQLFVMTSVQISN